MTSSEERFGRGFGGEGMWGLKELPDPTAVAYQPQTWGWLALAALGLLLSVGVVAWVRRRRRRNAYRTEALGRLDEAREHWRRALECRIDGDSHQYARIKLEETETEGVSTSASP